MKYKIKINTHLKFVLVLVFIILIFILFFVQYDEAVHPKNTTEEKIEFNYTAVSAIDYTVNIIENTVYDTTILPSDGTYISSLLNTIDIDFKHKFQGVWASALEGSYNITASVVGKIGGKDGDTLWKKDYELKPATIFYANNKDYSINDSVSIDYSVYDNIGKDLNTLLSVSTNNTLYVSMNISYSSTTIKGIVEEKFSPTLSIPLNTSYFNIERLNIEEKPGEIKSIISVLQPPNTLKTIVFRISIGLLIMLTLILIFYTVEPTAEDIYKKKIKKIFQSHGTRLVAINDDIKSKNEYYHDVHNFDDLVKISEELEKPIMYVYDSNISKMNKFYVFDIDGYYIYTVS